MKLLKPAQELLAELYENYQETGSLDAHLSYSNAYEEKRSEIQVIEQLVLAGLVKEIAPTLGGTTLQLTRAGIDYFEETCEQQPPVVTFNVSGNVENSILGSQTHATINVGADLTQLKLLIDAIDGPDKEQLAPLPEALADMQKGGQVKQGALARFSGVLTKYPKVFDTVGGLLAKLALGLFT